MDKEKRGYCIQCNHWFGDIEKHHYIRHSGEKKANSQIDPQPLPVKPKARFVNSGRWQTVIANV
ncbi:MAG: hypothetical protein M0R03_03475 [Novosphingobium sp.]|nr:hypothetical protein [Novosphingobium sp.]